MDQSYREDLVHFFEIQLGHALVISTELLGGSVGLMIGSLSLSVCRRSSIVMKLYLQLGLCIALSLLGTALSDQSSKSIVNMHA